MSDDLHVFALVVFASWIAVMRVVVAHQVISDVLCLFASGFVGRLQCKFRIHLLQLRTLLKVMFSFCCGTDLFLGHSSFHLFDMKC